MELIRRRSLGMYIYADPANKQQKLYNDKILAKAEAIRCKVYIDVLDEIWFLQPWQIEGGLSRIFQKVTIYDNTPIFSW